MVIRHALACTLVLGSLLPFATAQELPPPAPVKKPVPAAPATQPGDAQDPEKAIPKPIEETPEQRIQKLEAEQQKLLQEIKYVQDRASKGAMAAMVQDKLEHRALDLKGIDAGASKASIPVTPTSVVNAPVRQVQHARLMSDEEKAKAGEDVVFLVAGEPIHQADIDQLVAYQASFTSSGDDVSRKSRAVMELLRTAATAGAFPDRSAEVEKRMQALHDKIDSQQKFEDAAKESKQGPNAAKGGDLGLIMRNNWLGLQVERVAFSHGEGLTPVIRTPTGFAMLWLGAVEKGATPDLDKVPARIVTAGYIDDQGELNVAASKVMTGQVQIIVRDEDAMQMLPPMFRAQPQLPPSDGAPKNDADVDQPIKAATPDGTPIKKQ